MRRRTAFSVCGLLVFLLSHGLHSQNSQIIRSRDELSEIRERLSECRRRREEIEKEQEGTLAKLEILGEELVTADALIEALRREESLLKEEVERLQKRVAKVEKELTARKSILGARLREMYKHGRTRDLELILFSTSLSGMMKRLKYILLIAGQDKKLVDSTRALTQSLIAQKEELGERVEEETRLREEKESEKNRIRNEKAKREKILDKLGDEGEEKSKLEKELEAAEKKLVELIEKLEREAAQMGGSFQGAPLEEYKGKLRWPVDGEVISRFGKKRHPIYWTVTQNNGIDIDAGYGAPVHAVAAGKVVYAERFLGYGRVVLVDHGHGYYTLYAYLSEILVFVGSTVEEGDIIAYVGDSLDGDLFHFELRKKGKPDDPLDWLRPREDVR
jgi:septal ring factor EnvC (AmiA/AmiB activator)